MDADNIIQFPEKSLRPKVDRRRRKHDGTDKQYCRHQAVEIDDNAREVDCQLCGASLDPIKVLYDIAINEIRLQYTEKEYIELKEKTADLKAEEKRIKARIRTARKRM